MARPKRSRANRREQVYRQRLLSRKAKTRKIAIVSRRGQPQIVAEVKRLVRQDIEGPVASSWISNLAWDNTRKVALMLLINGYFYDVFISFNLFEEWFVAHSKGTFFNQKIKGKFKVVRTN